MNSILSNHAAVRSMEEEESRGAAQAEPEGAQQSCQVELGSASQTSLHVSVNMVSEDLTVYERASAQSVI